MKSTHRRRKMKVICTVSDFPDNQEGAKSPVREFLRRPGGVDVAGTLSLGWYSRAGVLLQS